MGWGVGYDDRSGGTTGKELLPLLLSKVITPRTEGSDRDRPSNSPKVDAADSSSLYLLVGVDNVRFRRPVSAGDQLRIVVDVINQKRGIWKFNVRADVEGDTVCTGELMSAHRRVD